MTTAEINVDAAAPAVGDARGALRRSLRRVGPTLAAFVAVRITVLSVFVATAKAQDRDPLRILGNWDGQWYRRIAEDGYGYLRTRPDGRVYEDYAFFPLLPTLERLGSWSTGLTALRVGLLISAVASVVAAWGIFAVVDRLYGPRAGMLVVLLWAALPVAIVSSMAYTETLFTALAAWALYCVLSEHWLAAGALAAAAGATRPSGLAVVAAVTVPAVSALLRRREPRPSAAERARIASALVLAPAGFLGYVAWVGYQRGRAAGYLEVADRWGNGADGGRAFVAWTWGFLSGGSSDALIGVAIVLAVGVLLALLWLSFRQGQPLPLLTYSVVLVVMALTTAGFFGSKPRYLFPAFALLLPVALPLARSPRRAAVVVTLMVAVSAAYGAIWLLGTGPP